MHHNEELALYEALRDSAPLVIPERSLFADLNIRLLSPITYAAFRGLLAKAKERNRALCVPGEDGMKWLITDDGWARLRQLGG